MKSEPLADRLRRVEVLLLDVDGVLTDGSIVYAGDDPETWTELATAYRDLGATHLRVLTGGNGPPGDHLATMLRWYEAVAPAVR